MAEGDAGAGADDAAGVCAGADAGRAGRCARRQGAAAQGAAAGRHTGGYEAVVTRGADAPGARTPSALPIRRGFDHHFGFLSGGQDHDTQVEFCCWCREGCRTLVA